MSVYVFVLVSLRGTPHSQTSLKLITLCLSFFGVRLMVVVKPQLTRFGRGYMSRCVDVWLDASLCLDLQLYAYLHFAVCLCTRVYVSVYLSMRVDMLCVFHYVSVCLCHSLHLLMSQCLCISLCASLCLCVSASLSVWRTYGAEGHLTDASTGQGPVDTGCDGYRRTPVEEGNENHASQDTRKRR